MMQYFSNPIRIATCLLYFAAVSVNATISRELEEDRQQQQLLSRQYEQEDDNRTLLILPKNTEFKNWSPNTNVGGTVDIMFTPDNGIPIDWDKPILQNKNFLIGLQRLQSIVKDALTNGKKVRAVGNRMSMSNIVYSPDYMIQTSSLTYYKIGIDNTEYIDESYTKPKEELLFVQAGVRLEELHLTLQKANLALPTTCFPNGMHFVGATLTGSHGSKIHLGSMDDYVRAIHIITDTGHYLIQKESNKVVTTAYASYLGNATLVSNDKLFNSAIVSFGAFGIVHGMLLAVEPMYTMEMEIQKYDYDDVKDVLSSLDMSKLNLKSKSKSNEIPYHIMFSINSYMPNTKGVTLQIYRKIESSKSATSADADAVTVAVASLPVTSSTGSFNDKKTRLLTIALLRILKLPKRLLYGMVMRIGLNISLSTSMTGAKRTPYNAHSFAAAVPRSPHFYLKGYTEMEVFVSSDDVTKVVELYRKTLNDSPIFTFLGLRYFSSTNATIGMGQFTPYTAAIATFSTESMPGTYDGFQNLFTALQNSGIPYVYHWGKVYPIEKEWIATQYGDNLVEWLQQRDEFLTPVGKEMFSNQQLVDIGLHVP